MLAQCKLCVPSRGHRGHLVEIDAEHLYIKNIQVRGMAI